MTIVQKGDLSAASFSNNNTVGSGGIAVRVDAGSTVKAAIDAAIAAGGGGSGPALTNTAPSTSSTTAATPAFVNAAIAAAGSGGSGPALTNTAPSTSSTTAATPAFVNAAIAAAGGGGGPALTNTAPSTSSTTAATPAFVNAAITAATPAATTTTAGLTTLTNTAPSTSSTTAATPAFVNAAIAAAGGGGGAPATASVAEIRAGHPAKYVTADNLQQAHVMGVDHTIRSTASLNDQFNGALTGINTSSATTGVIGIYADIPSGGSGASGTASAVLGQITNASAGPETQAISGVGQGGDSHGVRGASNRSSGVAGVTLLPEGQTGTGYACGVMAVNAYGANVPALVALGQGTGAGSNGVAAHFVTTNGSNAPAVLNLFAGTGTALAMTTNKNIQVAGTTVTSDVRLKRNIEAIDGATALEFVKQLRFNSYTKLQAESGVVNARKQAIALAETEIASIRKRIRAAASGNSNDDTVELLKALAVHEKTVKDGIYITDEDRRLGKEVGLIAQEVNTLVTTSFPQFTFVVSKGGDGYFTLDYNSIQNIFLAAVQYKLFA